MRDKMKRTVLLVEDDEPLRTVTREALERDFRVIEAAGCNDALAANLKRVDIAVIDYMLPGCDGITLLKSLRAVLPSLPAVIMTAYSTENLVIQALRAGATDYIRKPVRFSFLREKICEVLDGSCGDDEAAIAGSREETIIDGITSYIEDHYAENLTLEKLAGMAGMNRFRFCRVFKEKTRKSYTSYLNGVRIRNSLELLEKTDLSITKISNATGYSCLTYFERVFKQMIGMTPMEYRRRNHQAQEAETLP